MSLFEPLWKTNKPELMTEALDMVSVISDQKKLRNVALNASLSEVRCAAVKRITDEQILRDIILTKDSAFDVRKAAVHRIQDEGILTEIAMMRSCYPADGEAIAQLENQELLKKIAMSETGWEQAKAVYKIKTPADLREIAEKGEKAGPRKTAIRMISDPDVLLDIMGGSSERFIITEAFHRFDDLLRSMPEEDKRVADWHERYLNIVLKERQKDAKVNLDYFQKTSELERIYQKAYREDLRAEAFSRLIARRVYSPHNLKEACKQAFMNSLAFDDDAKNPWKTVLTNLETRILNSHDPSLLLECVQDSMAGCHFASACIRELFGDRFQDEVGIDWVQDESVAAYIGNIEAYTFLQYKYDMDYCLHLLSEAVPADAGENKWYRRFLRRVQPT